ncbi:heterokaryon incompatibility protein-domain-containing protein [Pisolithus marmoratus]|nr:heterokaryon incompatibility protein-domain-containing protein [Pisolithus marmoratus]
MRLINVHTHHLEMFNSSPPEYAILSHRWREEEILFQDIEEGRDIVARRGYTKFHDSCRRASDDGFDYIWIDTCCIDKSSSAELSEAINSMYQWYKNSALCYAYLDDVDDPVVAHDRAWGSALVRSEWFTRGWTLQELIAPRHVQFYTQDWHLIGSKVTLAHALKIVTRIPIPVLCHGLSSSRLSTAQILSWAANRVTTRVEDQAYSLMGLFGVFMPVLYGEGNHAFKRLQLEIMRTSNDQSIFAWDKQRFTGGVLADSPSFFAGLSDVRTVDPEEFVHGCVLDGERPEHSYTVTNSGIRICLPVVPYVVPQHPSHQYLEALLACCHSYSNEPLKITLLHVNGRYERTLGTPEDAIAGKLRSEVLNLAYEGDGEETGLTRGYPERSFEFHPTNISSHGFVRCCVVPEEATWAGQRLSMRSSGRHGAWHAVITYVSDMHDASFQLVVGYHSEQRWVHVLCNDDHIGGALPSSDTEAWMDHSWRIFERMWGERQAMAASMKEKWAVDLSMLRIFHRLIWRTHIPGTAMDVLLFCDEGLLPGDFAIKVDVDACPGRCSADSKMYKMCSVSVSLQLYIFLYTLHILLQIETPHLNVVCRHSGCYRNCHERCSAEPSYEVSGPLACEVFGGSEGETVAGTSSICLRCGHLRSSHRYDPTVWRLGPEIERKGAAA